MNKEEQRKQYYALLDLYEKGIQSIKENEYKEVDAEQYYQELTKIMTPEEEKEEVSDKN
jgi:hypothetical protein